MCINVIIAKITRVDEKQRSYPMQDIPPMVNWADMALESGLGFVIDPIASDICPAPHRKSNGQIYMI